MDPRVWTDIEQLQNLSAAASQNRLPATRHTDTGWIQAALEMWPI